MHIIVHFLFGINLVCVLNNFLLFLLGQRAETLHCLWIHCKRHAEANWKVAHVITPHIVFTKAGESYLFSVL